MTRKEDRGTHRLAGLDGNKLDRFSARDRIKKFVRRGSWPRKHDREAGSISFVFRLCSLLSAQLVLFVFFVSRVAEIACCFFLFAH